MQPGEESGQLNHRLADAVDLTDTTMEKIRLLARGLRPPELDAVGLNGTLGGYCSEFGRRTDLPIQYTGVEIPNLTDAVNISFYRAAPRGVDQRRETRTRQQCEGEIEPPPPHSTAVR